MSKQEFYLLLIFILVSGVSMGIAGSFLAAHWSGMVCEITTAMPPVNVK